MVRWFVVTWAYVLLIVALDVTVNPPSLVTQLALVPALALVAAGGAAQFSMRCPVCGYRLGWQSRLTVPNHCRKCRTALRAPESGADEVEAGDA